MGLINLNAIRFKIFYSFFSGRIIIILKLNLQLVRKTIVYLNLFEICISYIRIYDNWQACVVRMLSHSF